MLLPTTEQLTYMLEHLDDDKRTAIFASTTIELTAACVAVVLRLLARRLNKTPLKADDYLITASLIFGIVSATCFMLNTRYGLGRHVILLTDARAFAILMLLDEFAYVCSINCIKLSLLCLYNRIFSQHSHPRLRKASIALGVFITFYGIAHICVDMLQCIPLSGLWDPTVKAYCYPFATQIYTIAAINILTDMAVLLLPIRPIWHLQISHARKAQLTAMFTLGGLVCIVSIARMFFIGKMNSADPTWDDVDIGFCSGIELFLGIVAASLPACRPLLVRLHEKLGLSGGSGRGSARNMLRQAGSYEVATKESSSIWIEVNTDGSGDCRGV